MTTRIATFAAGCFWGIEKNFAALSGVVATRVGYTGGHAENPTYEQVCGKDTGHAEAVEVTYDPEKISYERLLKEFFRMHQPAGRKVDIDGQYRSAIFYHDDEQKTLAEKVVAELGVSTHVTPIETFWEAEERHQKYYLKRLR